LGWRGAGVRDLRLGCGREGEKSRLSDTDAVEQWTSNRTGDCAARPEFRDGSFHSFVDRWAKSGEHSAEPTLRRCGRDRTTRVDSSRAAKYAVAPADIDRHHDQIR